MVDGRGRQYSPWLTELLDMEDTECFRVYNLMTLRGYARNGII